MTFLSRGIVCSDCDKAPATHTLKDEDGQVLAYLCDKCAEQESFNEIHEMFKDCSEKFDGKVNLEETLKEIIETGICWLS